MNQHNSEEYEDNTELFDLIDKFMLHLGFAVHADDVDRFIELFSVDFFNKIPQEEKFNNGIIAVGSIPEMQEKYLHRFIFDTAISEKTLEDPPDENYWTRAGFEINQIKNLFSLRELKNELPKKEENIGKKLKV